MCLGINDTNYYYKMAFLLYFRDSTTQTAKFFCKVGMKMQEKNVASMLNLSYYHMYYAYYQRTASNSEHSLKVHLCLKIVVNPKGAHLKKIARRTIVAKYYLLVKIL